MLQEQQRNKQPVEEFGEDKKKTLLNKVKLLKDQDFKLMHNKQLPVHNFQASSIQELQQIIRKDVKLLSGMNIMDYSLFLVVVSLPYAQNSCYFVRDDEYERVTGIKNSEMDSH